MAKFDQRAFERVRRAAQAGVRYAQWKLAGCFLEGRHVEQDPSQGEAWFKQAADAGLYLAQRELANLSSTGILPERSRADIHKLYLAAARHGDADSQFKCGIHYLYGVGANRNLDRARNWFRRAALQGHSWAKLYAACLEAGLPHLPDSPGELDSRLRDLRLNGSITASYGLGILNRLQSCNGDRNDIANGFFEEAVNAGCERSAFELAQFKDNTGAGTQAEIQRLYRYSAQEGYLPAVARLGEIYLEEDSAKEAEKSLAPYVNKGETYLFPCYAKALIGTKGDKSLDEVIFLARRAINDGVIESRDFLAQVVIAFDDLLEPTSKLALTSLRLSAETGNPISACYLAQLLIDKLDNEAEGLFWLQAGADDHNLSCTFDLGRRLILADDLSGLDYLKIAADEGYTDSSVMLGDIFYEGSRVIAANRQVAARYYRKAARQGSKKGQTQIASLLLNNEVRPETKTEASTWILQAARGGGAPEDAGDDNSLPAPA